MLNVMCFLRMASNTTGNYVFFFFNDTATTEIYTLSLHDALPISSFFSFTFKPKILQSFITSQLATWFRPDPQKTSKIGRAHV